MRIANKWLWSIWNSIIYVNFFFFNFYWRIKQLFNVLTQNNFSIKVPFNNNVTDELIKKIEKALNQEEIELKNDDEKINFALFGKAINNKYFYEDIANLLNSEITNENVIKLVTTKYSFGYQISEIAQEIEYISEHFSQCKEEILKISKDVSYELIIELIIRNNKLKLKDEDELLQFILQLCKENKKYEYLIEYVWLENCSLHYIEELIEYANKNIFLTRSIRAFSTCFSRRLIQENIPNISSPNNEERYFQNYIEYNDTSQLYGILRHEHEKDNVILETLSGSIYIYIL